MQSILIQSTHRKNGRFQNGRLQKYRHKHNLLPF